MSRSLSLRLENKDFEELEEVSREWKADKSETARRLLASAVSKWKTEKALKDLNEHKISLRTAAKKTGLNLWELFELIKERRIDWTGYSKEDLEKDLKELEGK